MLVLMVSFKQYSEKTISSSLIHVPWSKPFFGHSHDKQQCPPLHYIQNPSQISTFSHCRKSSILFLTLWIYTFSKNCTSNLYNICILYIIYILYITHWFVIMQKNKNKRETSISSLWKTNKLDNFSLNNFNVAWVSYLHQSKLPILCSEKS